MQSINNHIMRTECAIDMKQTALEREYHKLLSQVEKTILTNAQFRLELLCRLNICRI